MENRKRGLLPLFIAVSLSAELLFLSYNQTSYQTKLGTPATLDITSSYAVGVGVKPIYQGGVIGATLTYTVTVANVGTSNDSYDLGASDDAGWGPSLSENFLEVPAGENRIVILSVNIPSGAICTIDNITVTATSKSDNTVNDNEIFFAHRGKATFGLHWKYCTDLWGVTLDLDLYLRDDSTNLIVQFYRYWDDYEGENLLWSGATPVRLMLKENILHPLGKGHVPEKVRLILTDNEGNLLQTIVSYVVTKSALFTKYINNKIFYPIVPLEGKICIFRKLSKIKAQFPFAPS